MTNYESNAWHRAKLHDIAEIILGQSPPGSSYNSSGVGIPFFQGKADFGDKHPTVRHWTTSPKKMARRDDILLSVRAPVGPTNIAATDCCIGRGLAAIRAREGVTPGYLLWALKASAADLAAQGTGTTFDAISGNQLKNHVLRIAPLAEQHHIVAAIEEQFSRLDAAVASLERAKRNLARMRAAVIRQHLTLPTWPRRRLGDIADVVGGVTKDSKRENLPGLVRRPYLRVANVQRGRLDLSDVTWISLPENKALALALRPGDILLNEGGDRDKLGRGWVWEGQIADCIHQNHVFRARLHDMAVDPYFVSTYANEVGRDWFERMGKQTTNLASISLRVLKEFPVPAGPIEAQEAIMRELARTESVVVGVERSIAEGLDRSKLLRQAILKEAFAGRLVAHDEVADSSGGPADHVAEFTADVRQLKFDEASAR